MTKSTIYLDYAAATPMDEQVKKVMEPYYSEKFYNPSANYIASKQLTKEIALARAKIAYWLGSKPNEIIFTAGGTEANNLAINGIMSNFPNSNIIISSIEHESVVKPAEKYSNKSVNINLNGELDIENIEKLIDDNTVLISVMYANNEIGLIQPLIKLSKKIKKIRLERNKKGNKLPLYLHTDACQVPSFLDIHVDGLGVDLMTLNSGKIYGAKQFGVLYIQRDVKISPQILGGGQEMGLRSGTESPANIIGFAKALDLVQISRHNENVRLTDLQNYFVAELLKLSPSIAINGPIKNRLPNNVNIRIAGYDNETVLMKLDEMGIQCASGSACNAANDELSMTLLAIGLSEEEVKSSIRFTFGKYTTKNDLKFVIESMSKIIQ